jgi:hypothetical protein
VGNRKMKKIINLLIHEHLKFYNSSWMGNVSIFLSLYVPCQRQCELWPSSATGIQQFSIIIGICFLIYNMLLTTKECYICIWYQNTLC